MSNPTVAERIDPNSPHYDAEFAEMRRKAFAAHADHEKDMAEDPNYRKEYKKYMKGAASRQPR